MKRILLLLLFGSLVCCNADKEKKLFYKSKPLKAWLEIYRKNRSDAKARTAILDYHQISEEKFIALTHDFWNKNPEMEYKILDKTKVSIIDTWNNSSDPAQHYKYVKFSPTDLLRADDIKYSPVNYDSVNPFDPTNSSYIIEVFDILNIAMKSTDVILLTKGFEYIKIPNNANPIPPEKPYIFKGRTVVVFMMADKDGNIKGYYDISHDPDL